MYAPSKVSVVKVSDPISRDVPFAYNEPRDNLVETDISRRSPPYYQCQAVAGTDNWSENLRFKRKGRS